jgi:hypothetical protein
MTAQIRKLADCSQDILGSNKLGSNENPAEAFQLSTAPCERSKLRRMAIEPPFLSDSAEDSKNVSRETLPIIEQKQTAP